MPTLLPVDDLASLYRATLVKMDRAGGQGTGARPRGWDKLVDQMQFYQLALRVTPDGRSAITQMVDDPCPTVRSWSAANALAWDPEVALAALHREIGSGSGASSDAEIVLREHIAGRLNTAWAPAGRPPRRLR
ncbi:hypothetical protein [Aeromicrobium sp.]|uniref:hypothetical protein n=1 Tax=Aeromicrobium sp. TaxID=1871063 RepID=UPI0019B205B7|nr:hypothetical protein [Aeromicrobium sp.]MBC7629946.1 hypothetical protein [Aeromicrobium sp.]